MKARLIAVGERAPSWVAQGFADYRQRLSHWLPLELVEIEPGLRGKGRDAVLGINLGLEGQELHRLSDLDDDRSAPYFSAVLAPAHRGETGGRL